MKISLVVVDDDDVDRYLVKRICNSLDVDIDFAEFVDGEDFLELLRDRERIKSEIGETPPRFLVLLDINMPRVGGFEVLESLSSDADLDTESMYVLMHSSSGYANDKIDSEKYPFVKDYIVKPLTADRLTNVVDTLYA